MTKPAKKTAAERESMIRVAAYYLYERQGRQAGRELEDWVAAEAQVDAMLNPAGPAAATVEARAAAGTGKVVAAPKAGEKSGPGKVAKAARAARKPAATKVVRAAGPSQDTPAAKPAAKRTRAAKS